MNDFIAQLTSHTSIRQYTDEPISDDIIAHIVEATQHAPTWVNAQHVSIIRISDAQQRTKLQQVAGNQAHIGRASEFWVFCVDFHRTKLAMEIEGKAAELRDTADLLLVGTTDVGIAIGTAVAAAESFGLGTVCIGGVRREAAAVCDILELPAHVYPIAGLCIGHPAEKPLVKPRLPKEAVFFDNRYHPDLKQAIHTYNDTFSSYMHARSAGASSATWTSSIAQFYGEAYNNSYLDADDTLKRQQFFTK